MIPQMAGATFVGPMARIPSRALTAPPVSTCAHVASTGPPRTALRKRRSVLRISVAHLAAPTGGARGRATSRRRGAAGHGQWWCADLRLNTHAATARFAGHTHVLLPACRPIARSIRRAGCGTRLQQLASAVRPALTCKRAPGTRTWSKWSIRAAPMASFMTRSRHTIASAVDAALTSAHNANGTPGAREIRPILAGSIASIRRCVPSSPMRAHSSDALASLPSGERRCLDGWILIMWTASHDDAHLPS